MARKQVIEGGTRNKIIEVGMKMFFEKGYDGAGIRQIMKEVGLDVGAFYYYFKTKDDLFVDVLNYFFQDYVTQIEEMVEEAKKMPFRALMRAFTFMAESIIGFREKYGDNIHCTVRWAIRERTLTLMEPYMEQIIEILIENGAKPRMDAHTTAVFLTHGVGSIFTHEDAEWFNQAIDDIRKTVNYFMGLDPEAARLMFANNPASDEMLKHRLAVQEKG